MSNAQPEKFDVVIVGAGPVGMTLALALAQSMRGLRIALVDRRELSVPKDNRASAIAAGVPSAGRMCWAFISTISAWPRVM